MDKNCTTCEHRLKAITDNPCYECWTRSQDGDFYTLWQPGGSDEYDHRRDRVSDDEMERIDFRRKNKP